MKTTLAALNGIAGLTLAALLTNACTREVKSDAASQRAATEGNPVAQSSNPPTGGSAASQELISAAKPISLGRGDDPLNDGEPGACTHSYDPRKVKELYVLDANGNRVNNGRIQFWLRTDCPSGATVTVGPPSGGPGAFVANVEHFNLREARLRVNCNTERFWVEFAQYTQDGRTVFTHQPRHGDDGDARALEGSALERLEEGKIITPNSVLAPFTARYCPEVQEGTPVK